MGLAYTPSPVPVSFLLVLLSRLFSRTSAASRLKPPAAAAGAAAPAVWPPSCRAAGAPADRLMDTAALLLSAGGVLRGCVPGVDATGTGVSWACDETLTQ
jgi:hypothetical protein